MKIDKNSYHGIQLKSVQLVELNCKFNEEVKRKPGKNTPVSINISNSSRVISSKLGICYLNVEIGFENKEEEIFSIDVTYKGICEVTDEIDEDELKFFLEIQSIPMLWAYIRETVNNIMLKMNLTPLVLPTINITNIAKKIKKENKNAGGTKNDVE